MYRPGWIYGDCTTEWLNSGWVWGLICFFFFFGWVGLFGFVDWAELGLLQVTVLMGPGQIRGVMGWVSELFSNWGPKYPG